MFLLRCTHIKRHNFVVSARCLMRIETISDLIEMSTYQTVQFCCLGLRKALFNVNRSNFCFYWDAHISNDTIWLSRLQSVVWRESKQFLFLIEMFKCQTTQWPPQHRSLSVLLPGYTSNLVRGHSHSTIVISPAQRGTQRFSFQSLGSSLYWQTQEYRLANNVAGTTAALLCSQYVVALKHVPHSALFE